MGWLLLGLGVAAAWVLSGRPRFRVYEGEDGTWAFALYKRGQVVSTETGFASEGDATAAAVEALAFLENPFGQQQGGATPPVVPPLPPPPPVPATPYLRVTSPPVQGLATAGTSSTSWQSYGGTGGDKAGQAATSAGASAALLEAVNSAANPTANVTIELRRADGTFVRSVVSQINLQTWQWSVVTPPAVPGGVGSSKTDASWRALTRLAAMRGALVQLQGES